MLRLDNWRCGGVPSGHRHTTKHMRAATHDHRRTSARTATVGPQEALSSSSSESSITVDRSAAWELLRDFTLKEFHGIAQDPYLSSSEKRQRLRDALKLAYEQPFPPAGWLGPSADCEVLLGVVASDIKFAARAYRDWCEELRLPMVTPTSRVDGVSTAMQLRGGVYLKYNSKTQLCYVTRYDGRDRGVLVQLGQLQLGHFPLGLFDESLSKPAPTF